MDVQPFLPQRIAILTISDTRQAADDRSGDTLTGRLEAAGHVLAVRHIVSDDIPAIREALSGFIDDPAIDIVISTGGTGFTGRDVTPEAAEPLFEKRMDGFSFLFHQISAAKIGTTTLLSRATAGIANGTIIFCLPGSPGACKDAWDGIIGPQLDARTKPHNLVLLKPRLNEHRR
jgi:molybdenum cofactor biosynthesis protein B